MSSLEFFQTASRTRRIITPTQFYEHWKQCAEGKAKVPAKSFAPFLFHVAKITGHDSGRTSFDKWKDMKRARSYVIKQLPSLLSDPQIESFQFNPVQLNQMIAAFRILQAIPPDDFKEKFLEQSLKVMAEANHRQYPNLVKNLAELAIYPGDEWIESWWEHASESLGDMDDNQLDELPYWLAVLDYLRGFSLSPSRALASQSPCKDMAIAILEIYRDNKERFFPNKLIPKPILDAAKWFKFDLIDKDYQSEPESTSHSKDEMYLKEVLRFFGAELLAQRPTENRHEYDILGKFNKISFALEIDGWPHMLEKCGDPHLYYDGLSRFRTSLLSQDSDVKLVRIPTVYLMDGVGMTFEGIARSILDNLKRFGSQPKVMHSHKSFRSVEAPNAWVLAR
jgi:hypothetical protein